MMRFSCLVRRSKNVGNYNSYDFLVYSTSERRSRTVQSLMSDDVSGVLCSRENSPSLAPREVVI